MIRPGSFETRNNKQHASLSIKAGVLFILHCGNTVILMTSVAGYTRKKENPGFSRKAREKRLEFRASLKSNGNSPQGMSNPLSDRRTSFSSSGK